MLVGYRRTGERVRSSDTEMPFFREGLFFRRLREALLLSDPLAVLRDMG